MRHFRADLSEAYATVAKVEDGVLARPERSLLQRADEIVDRDVEPLDYAGQDLRAKVGLVDVDADAPDALLLGRLERSEPARSRDREDSARALRDLAECQRLALVRGIEVVRVRVQGRDLRIGLTRA